MNDLDQYIKSIKSFGRISHEREKELSEIILKSKDDNKIRVAREEFIHANLLLVVDRALKMANKYAFLRINVMDLISEGNIGLMRAAETYNGDHNSHAVFSTFAVQSIDHKMKRAVQKDRFIHLPESYIKLRVQLNILKDKYGDKLTDEIIFKDMDITKDMLEVLKDDSNKNVVSLEDVFIRDDSDESTWNDIVEDAQAIIPSDEMSKKNMMDYLDKYISKLNAKEQFIIRERHFKPEAPSLDDISVTMKIPRERARQVYHTALRKLKKFLSIEWQCQHGEREEDPKIPPYLSGRAGWNQYYAEKDSIRNKMYGKVFNHLLNGEE
jgi:RNA polymerase primary sigma factor